MGNGGLLIGDFGIARVVPCDARARTLSVCLPPPSAAACAHLHRIFVFGMLAFGMEAHMYTITRACVHVLTHKRQHCHMLHLYHMSGPSQHIARNALLKFCDLSWGLQCETKRSKLQVANCMRACKHEEEWLVAYEHGNAATCLIQ